MHQLNIYNLD